MTQARRTIGMLAVAAVVAAPWVGRARTATPGEDVPPAAGRAAAGNVPAAPASPFLGAGSCSGRACHGGLGLGDPTGREFHVWARQDHHARAFEVLRDDRSAGIATRLHAKDVKKPAATDDALCLKCHLGPRADSPAEPAVPALTGVDCEACHGAARPWLKEHVAWGKLSGTAKEAQQKKFGMTPLATVTQRVATCVPCHVGDATRQVNHDLIAAGHPRLNFEFAAFLGDMPRHWREKPGYSEPASWQVGQVATAKAALVLLKHRAREAQTKGGDQPWPEFTEIDCFACHHDLHKDGAVRQRKYAGVLGDRGPGAFPWGSWYFAVLYTLGDPKEVGAPLKALADAMGRTQPDAARVEALSDQAIKALDAWLTALEQDPPGPKAGGALAAGLLKAGGKTLAEANWDAAAQLYLALAALADGPGQRDAVARLAGALGFRKGKDSPGDYRVPEGYTEALRALGAGRD